MTSEPVPEKQTEKVTQLINKSICFTKHPLMTSSFLSNIKKMITEKNDNTENISLFWGREPMIYDVDDYNFGWIFFP